MVTEGTFKPKGSNVEAIQYDAEETIPFLVLWCSQRGIKYNATSEIIESPTLGSPNDVIDNLHFLVWSQDGYYALDPNDWIVYEKDTSLIRLMSNENFAAVYEVVEGI